VDLLRHSDAMAFISETQPLFIIKSNEFAASLTSAPIFTGQRVLHIIRNGLDVVTSSIERGWYTDEWCARQIDWAETTGAPWWADTEAKLAWGELTPLTRAASCWRALLNYADVIPGVRRIQYEELAGNPAHFVGLFEQWYGLKQTEITERHIRGSKPRPRPRIDLNDIQMPEREKFREKMEQLRYL